MTSTQAPERTLERAVSDARDLVLQQRQIFAQWESKKSSAETALVELHDHAGDQLLDNPDAEDLIGERVTKLQSQALLAEKAIAAQRPRIVAAESAYLHAEADLLEAIVEPAEAELAEHLAKTVNLKRALEQHQGVAYMTEYEHQEAMDSALDGSNVIVWDGGSRVRHLPRSLQLTVEAGRLRRQADAVRAMALGGDPRSKLVHGDDLPRCLAGASALVPTHHYLASVQHMREHLAELESALESLPDEIKHDENVAAREGAESNTPADRRRARLQELPAEIEKARADFAALTGEARLDEAAAS